MAADDSNIKADQAPTFDEVGDGEEVPRILRFDLLDLTPS